MSAPPQTRIRHRYSRCSRNHGPITHGGVGGRILRLNSEMPRKTRLEMFTRMLTAFAF